MIVISGVKHCVEPEVAADLTSCKSWKNGECANTTDAYSTTTSALTNTSIYNIIIIIITRLHSNI